MENTTAAAILVQTIMASSENLRAQLAGQAEQNPTAATDFLRPYFVEAVRSVKKAYQENPAIR
jgi:hypothetical protein